MEPPGLVNLMALLIKIIQNLDGNSAIIPDQFFSGMFGEMFEMWMFIFALELVFLKVSSINFSGEKDTGRIESLPPRSLKIQNNHLRH